MCSDYHRIDNENADREIEYKIEIGTQTLERNIGFIEACDNKTSIVLATFGVLLTIILTNEGLKTIHTITESCIRERTFCSLLYLACFVSSMLTLICGLTILGSILTAKVEVRAKGKKRRKSLIFFSGICRKTGYRSYYEAFLSVDRASILRDITDQIYINAAIAESKYGRYNKGLRITVVGFSAFIVLLLVGSYLY